MADLFTNTLAIYLDAAPWLLLGLIAAGLIKAWVSEAWMTRWLGGRGFGPVARAAIIGAPLPLCSCGVLPSALGLRRSGASRGSTLSFLIATPETGVDSVAITYALMGPFMAIIRPIAAIFSAVFTGVLGGLVPEKSTSPAATPDCQGGCCGSLPIGQANPSPETPWTRSLSGLRYAMTDILDDLTFWLAIGIIVAGALITWLPPQALAQWGSGVPAMLVMLAIGVPMYICATASTPLAASLLLLGVSPGTVLVFLLAGPATNIATLGLLHRELGGPVLAVYLFGISAAAIACGLATDALVQHFGISVMAQAAETGEFIPDWLGTLSAMLIAVFAIRPVRRTFLDRNPTAKPGR
ncbi:SO_0444 family Cu/Zn efflux transporter [Thiohalomonas denitrificans]|uniref:SO_0444 family Cu/Zn efflux transporter n=1 Tax=Thiohalomonas denitrificans TaxID=415747 RepID=UPI0026ED8FCD|nr:SO_0444 family Cu/Zn efflux transporter [Thiohalomonas denitrificans]